MAGKGVPPERLVVVYDDLDIPLGEIRVRKKGRPGTHKGMISIVGEIRTDDFPRIRIGIGPLPGGPGRGRFRPRALQARTSGRPSSGASKTAGEALEMILDGDIDRAMTRFNHRARATPRPPRLSHKGGARIEFSGESARIGRCTPCSFPKRKELLNP